MIVNSAGLKKQILPLLGKKAKRMISELEKTPLLPTIKKARSFLNNHKWGQGSYYNPQTNAYCAMGAVRHVSESFSFSDRIERYLQDNCVPHQSSVTGYNDMYDRKKKEIIEMFDCAIEKLEAENS